MYSGLLPKGLSEAELSSDEEEEPTDEEEEPNAQSDTETEKLQAESDPNVPNDLTPSAPSSSAPSSSAPSSSAPSSSAPSSPPESCWPGVSQELCQKFKDLQKKRESQKTDKPPGRKRGKKRHRKGGTCKQTSGDAEEKKDGEEIRLKKLQELTQYFGTNDRFQPPVCSRPSPKSGLEKNMERAIAEGDYGKAEELSDRLATRENHRSPHKTHVMVCVTLQLPGRTTRTLLFSSLSKVTSLIFCINTAVIKGGRFDGGFRHAHGTMP